MGFWGSLATIGSISRGIAPLAAPLTALTKKQAFQWSETTQKAFERHEGCSHHPSPVLVLPVFSRLSVMPPIPGLGNYATSPPYSRYKSGLEDTSQGFLCIWKRERCCVSCLQLRSGGNTCLVENSLLEQITSPWSTYWSKGSTQRPNTLGYLSYVITSIQWNIKGERRM